MFGFLKKSFKLMAPVTGTVIELSEVPDEIFARKMAGDGLAIKSTGDLIVAPADGEISLIFKTNHAFGMSLDNGIEILIHIGLDTIGLEGVGFVRIAEEGQRVIAGEPVIKIDREYILDRKCSLITPLLIANPENAKILKPCTGFEVQAGKDIVLEYKLK